MSTTRFDRHGPVAVLTLDNPPVNGLGHELRQGIVDALDKAEADSEIRALVLIGGGKGFSGGADIKEFTSAKALADPTLRSVIKAIEGSKKPIVAAIHGMAIGGGIELALACHYRLAAPTAQIGLGEVKLGLLPGAGGTQRLPRVVGLETALNLVVSGNPVPAEALRRTALFDEIVEGDLLERAIAFAGKAAQQKLPPLVRDLPVRDAATAEGLVSFARNVVTSVSKGYPAPLKALEAVAASATQSFEEGLKTERALFLELMVSPESRALRHAFFAERAASKIPDVPEESVKPRPIKKAAVVGAGTMGGGIAMNFANAGIPVALLEVKEDALQRGVGIIRKNYENSARKGKLTAAQVEERMGLIRPTLKYQDLADADLVIEAVFEEIGVKEGVFRTLDEMMKPGAILATNTSTLDVNKIASFTRRPQDVVGTHFFSPANVMKLLEVVRGEKTAKDVLATVMDLGKKLRKTAVVSGICDGFIGNRMLHRYLRQANLLLEEGALPQDVDSALEKWGMAMGPFRVADLAGNDVGWFIRKRHYAEDPNAPRLPLADRICELGRFGQKTGAGWYRYEAGKRDAIADKTIEELIAAHRKQAGIEPRKLSAEEIVERCIFALVNEGAKILAEGIVQRASDIDIVYLTGYGFPAFRGGPMFYADTVGLYNVVRSMNRFARNPRADPGFWKPAPLLASLAAEGKTFN